jgi:hypothetical protein
MLLRTIATIAFTLLPLAAIAAGFPSAECALNADKSSVVIIASNPSDTGYKCMASCRAKVNGQRALERVECNFNLARNAAEKTVCSRDGGAPKFYTEVSPTKHTCVPRN